MNPWKAWFLTTIALVCGFHVASAWWRANVKQSFWWHRPSDWRIGFDWNKDDRALTVFPIPTLALVMYIRLRASIYNRMDEAEARLTLRVEVADKMSGQLRRIERDLWKAQALLGLREPDGFATTFCQPNEVIPRRLEKLDANVDRLVRLSESPQHPHVPPKEPS